MVHFTFTSLVTFRDGRVDTHTVPLSLPSPSLTSAVNRWRRVEPATRPDGSISVDLELVTRDGKTIWVA